MEHNQRLAGARFEIEKLPRTACRFSFFDARDHLVFRSDPFHPQARAVNAVEVLKRSIRPSSFQRVRARNGSGFYFTVNGAGNELLATSRLFMSSTAMEQAIACAARDIPDAPVFDSCAVGS